MISLTSHLAQIFEDHAGVKVWFARMALLKMLLWRGCTYFHFLAWITLLLSDQLSYNLPQVDVSAVESDLYTVHVLS